MKKELPFKIVIVTPVFDDWDCLSSLLVSLGRIAGEFGDLSVMVVDDCSTVPQPSPDLPMPPGIRSVEYLRLHSNVGHQRAIAIGLSVVAGRPDFDMAIVMDSDGEDRPEEVPKLIEAHARHPNAVVVAQRQKRSEPFAFRVMYRLFKLLFLLLTGRAIDFGNFCLIPRAHLNRLVYMRETWTHVGAALLKSRLPIIKVSTVRGQRYSGKSTMSVSSLIIHGFSAISVFVDAVFVRLIIGCGILVAMATVLGFGAALVRLGTNAAVPGWATSVVGFAALMVFQALTLLMVAVLMMLANRSALPVIPAKEAQLLIQSQRMDTAT